MKLLPCDSPSCAGQGALLAPNKAHPGGEPYLAGRHASEVRCWRCKRTTFVSAARFNGLPELLLEDFDRLGMKRLPTRDLEGAGFKRGHAEDLFRSGLDVHVLHALDRAQEDERQLQEALSAGATPLELKGQVIE